MDEPVRHKLRELVAEHGQGLAEDRKRCRTLLKEHCEANKRAIELLVGAVEENVALELTTAPPGEPREQLLADLTQRLRDDKDWPAQEARWAVETWAEALGVLEPAPTVAPPVTDPPTEASTPAFDIEKPACFYLGREYDLASRTVLADRAVMYDARDLLTHGVVVGMTGSGKTGLCITLLEEAAIDRIPCILIDPKGDLTNLLLQFPDLDPAHFEKWLNLDDARQKGVSLQEHARQVAERWRQGLTESGQPVDRIQRLRDACDWRVYTPGSEAGLPLSILKNFAAPKGANREALNQKIDATTTALLGLTGISSDPVQSREHIFIAQLLLHAWSKGRDMDLAQLIAAVQEPPLRTIGTLDVDTFYPPKERLKLAVALNNILASPSFSTWVNGDALDLSRLLQGSGKTRQLIFYVAHLDDAQRMFFITLLLEEVLSWTRKQAGTTNLRAILYFDEVFGYLPPHPANPPTKQPLMTLLKQARAFGLGVLLATQNPVDLDYKALSNAGTWFVGKLQTERDKARLLEGLEGVAAERGTLTNRAYLETVISSLGNRVFLLHNVHRGQPLLFQTRWALSFLRGPMTSDQVRLLMDEVREREKPPVPQAQAVPVAQPAAASPAIPRVADDSEARFKQDLERSAAANIAGVSHVQPVVSGVAQFFLPLANPVRPAEANLLYLPRVLGVAEVAFVEKKRGLEHRRPYRSLWQPPASGQPIAWHASEACAEALAPGPEENAHWGELPESINSAKKIKAMEKAYADYLYSNARLTLLHNRTLDILGSPGEDVLAFQVRCRELAQQEADQVLAEERRKYEPKFKALGATIPAGDEKQGSLLLKAITFVPLTLLALYRDPSRPEKDQTKLRELITEWHATRKEIAEKWERVSEEYSELLLSPRRADVTVHQFGIAWAPFWRVTAAEGRFNFVPAYR